MGKVCVDQGCGGVCSEKNGDEGNGVHIEARTGVVDISGPILKMHTFAFFT